MNTTHPQKVKSYDFEAPFISYLVRYSRVPNKQTGRLLKNEKNPIYTHLLAPIFIHFCQLGSRKYVSHWHGGQKKGF